MSCQRGPKRRDERRGWGPGRAIAVVMAGCLASGGAAAWAAGTEPDRAGVWEMPGGEVPGQAGTLSGRLDPQFKAARDRLAVRVARQLAQVDEQVEMIDEIIDGREQSREGERYDETIELELLGLVNARAELRYKRRDAGEALERVRRASEDHWAEVQGEAKAAVVALDRAYDDTVRKLYK